MAQSYKHGARFNCLIVLPHRVPVVSLPHSSELHVLCILLVTPNPLKEPRVEAELRGTQLAHAKGH